MYNAAATTHFVLSFQRRMKSIALPSISNLTAGARTLYAAGFYFVCSISMNFLNKMIISSYGFNFPAFIMVCQMAVTVLVLDLLRLSGRLSITPYTLRSGMSFLPASLCFGLHSTLSLTALEGMNIPMYGAVKRCTPLVNLALSVAFLRKRLPSVSVTVSIACITAGCIIASAGDLEFDRRAYTTGALSVLAQAGYLTLVQMHSEKEKSSGEAGSALDMVYINSCNTLPVFLLASFLVGETSALGYSNSYSASGFLPTFVLLVFSGSLLTYSQFLCAAVCSALTASLVGVAKSVLQTIIGFFTFGGVPFHPLNVLGLLLNTIGGCLYSYAKYHESQRRRARTDDKLSEPLTASKENGLPYSASSGEMISVVVDGGRRSTSAVHSTQYSAVHRL